MPSAFSSLVRIELSWSSVRTCSAWHRRAGASQGARLFRVSSVPRPGRDVFADLIRPSEPPWGHSMTVSDTVAVGRTPAESITQLMSEGYVDTPILVSLVFSLILLRDTPLDMLTSWADLR